jgi:hypothetical protein
MTATLTIQDNVFGYTQGNIHPAILQAPPHLVDGLVQVKRDVKPFVCEHPLMGGDPQGHVEIISRDGASNDFFHVLDYSVSGILECISSD